MNTAQQLRRYRRHLYVYAHNLFALVAMGERAAIAVDVTLTRIEQTIAEMNELERTIAEVSE